MSFLPHLSFRRWKRDKFASRTQEVVESVDRESCAMPGADKTHRILIADDQPAVLDALKMLLRSEGFQVDTVRSPQVALESLGIHEYDAVLMDLNYARDTTSGHEGMELLEAIRATDSQLPIIVMSAWGT